MSTFSRRLVSGMEVNPETLAVSPSPVLADYGSALTIKTHTTHFDARLTVIGLSVALGDQITKLLITIDATSTVGVASSVLEDHVFQEDPNPKDLQLNLLLNVIKEIVMESNTPTANRSGRAEDIIRRCLLGTDFKLTLKKALFDDASVHSPYIQLRHWPHVMAA